MKKLAAFSIALVTVAAPAASAFAQKASEASQETSVPGGTLLIIAYIAFVVIMLGYLALLSFRQRKLDRDIDELEKRLDELAEL